MKRFVLLLIIASCGGSEFESIEAELQYKPRRTVCERALLEANKGVQAGCNEFIGCKFCECWDYGMLENKGKCYGSVHEIFNSWNDESCKEDHEAALFCKDNSDVCASWFDLMVSVKCGGVNPPRS